MKINVDKERNHVATNLLDLVTNEVRSYYTHTNLQLKAVNDSLKDERRAVTDIQKNNARDSLVLPKAQDQTTTDESFNTDRLKNSDGKDDNAAGGMETMNDTVMNSSLKSIWDISPVTQEIKESVINQVPPFLIPIEKISPACKTNKKRSRATSTAPRELFKMADNLSPLEVVSRMNKGK